MLPGPPQVLDGLRTKGHDLATWPDFTWRAGAVCIIVADHKTSVLPGGPTFAARSTL